MIILSRNPLNALQILQIKQILRESRCPNESLRSTFENYSGLVGNKIFFDDAQQIYHDLAAKDMKTLLDEIDACPQITLTVI